MCLRAGRLSSGVYLPPGFLNSSQPECVFNPGMFDVSFIISTSRVGIPVFILTNPDKLVAFRQLALN
jgi:hypothetical protein